MTEETNRLRAEIEDAHQRLAAEWGELRAEDYLRRPYPDGWTPVELLEHVKIVLEQVVGLLHRLWERSGKAARRATEPRDLLAALDGQRVVDPVDKIEAPPYAQPVGEADPVRLLAAIEELCIHLDEFVVSIDGLDVREVRRDHFVLGALDAHQWSLFAAQHARRHTKQLQRIRRDLAEMPAQSGEGE